MFKKNTKKSWTITGAKRAGLIAAVALLGACARNSTTNVGNLGAHGTIASNMPDMASRKAAVIAFLADLSANRQYIAGTQVNEYEVYLECTSMDKLAHRVGKEPALMGMELMFAGQYAHYEDRLVARATAFARQGGLVTLAWHARNPIETCVRGEFYDCSKIAISDAALDAMLTPGTRENRAFRADAAILARTLKRLEAANFPVMFRPFHEMNGGWFWWGQKDAYPRLWDALYDELVGVHGINNLIWVWSGDKAVPDARRYWPLRHAPDIVGTDIYDASDNGAVYYSGARDVRAISGSQPFGFTEVGKAPSQAVLETTNPAFVLLWGGEFLDNRIPAPHDCASCNEPGAIEAFFARSAMITLNEIDGDFRDLVAGGRHTPIASRPNCLAGPLDSQ